VIWRALEDDPGLGTVGEGPLSTAGRSLKSSLSSEEFTWQARWRCNGKPDYALCEMSSKMPCGRLTDYSPFDFVGSSGSLEGPIEIIGEVGHLLEPRAFYISPSST
jgi:hypothetical protein